MFCKNCGNALDDNAVVCTKCGVQVGEIQPVAKAETKDEKTPNTVGLVGFILAMSGALFWLIGVCGVPYIVYVALALAIGAIVCSALGMKKANRDNSKFKGLSIAGLVVGIVLTALTIILIIIGLAALAQINNTIGDINDYYN